MSGMPFCLRSPATMAIALALFGCGGKVAVDREAGSAPPAGIAGNALVLTQTPPDDFLCSSDVDEYPNLYPPGTVYLFVASQPITCAQPELVWGPPPDMHCAPAAAGHPFLWEACIPLLPELAPETIDFYSYGAYAELASVTPDCSTASLPLLQAGTIAITMVDPSSVTFSLSGTDQTLLEGHVASDGTYEALRCP